MKVFKLMGIESVILTCAAGGINQSFQLGEIKIEELNNFSFLLRQKVKGKLKKEEVKNKNEDKKEKAFNV